MRGARAIAGFCLMMFACAGSTAERPAEGLTSSIGGAAAGCLQGGVPLPAEGRGWQVLRPDNNRYWGTPALIGFLVDFG